MVATVQRGETLPRGAVSQVRPIEGASKRTPDICFAMPRSRYKTPRDCLSQSYRDTSITEMQSRHATVGSGRIAQEPRCCSTRPTINSIAAITNSGSTPEKV